MNTNIGSSYSSTFSRIFFFGSHYQNGIGRNWKRNPREVDSYGKIELWTIEEMFPPKCRYFAAEERRNGTNSMPNYSTWKEPQSKWNMNWWTIVLSINVYVDRGYSRKHVRCKASQLNYPPCRFPVSPGPLFPSTWSIHPAAAIDPRHEPWPPTEHLKLLHPLHTLGAIPCVPSERIPTDSWFSISQVTWRRKKTGSLAPVSKSPVVVVNNNLQERFLNKPLTPISRQRWWS